MVRYYVMKQFAESLIDECIERMSELADCTDHSFNFIQILQKECLCLLQRVTRLTVNR